MQIEVKQSELIPWSEKINQKQSEIDIAKTEFDLLEANINQAGREIDKANDKLNELRPVEAQKASLCI